ncbi:hypothetical protein XENTR_v10015226 [Xenopus tropicalis]|nr:hypothetical protein XENTR_v10015226 [Xenopus tropicalis]
MGVILLGFPQDPTTNVTTFLLFFLAYLVTCIGNCLIICIILLTPSLRIPMYYFICNLSFLDLCYSSSVVPKLLADVFSTQRTISHKACVAQLYITMLLGGAEGLLLAMMAYDRFVAICYPLYYGRLMSSKMCYLMSVCVWSGSFLLWVVPSLAMRVTFCFNKEINHFMCEVLEMIKLVCEDIYVKEVTLHTISSICLIIPFAFIIGSYVCIIATFLKIPSLGRWKTFSTCTSHIIVVFFCYGTAMIMYFGPASNYSANQLKFASIFYVVVTPMLNPIIYSLKNKDVKDAFKKLLSKMIL